MALHDSRDCMGNNVPDVYVLVDAKVQPGILSHRDTRDGKIDSEHHIRWTQHVM